MVQEAVEQRVALKRKDGVRFEETKLKPEMVTNPAPDDAEFSGTKDDVTGASNVNTDSSVPIIWLTV